MIVWSIARTTVGDAMRKKVLQIFLVVTIALIVLALSFSGTLEFTTKRGAATNLMMLKSFGMGLMAVAGMFITLVLGISLIPQEIERRTIYTILAKPVKRYEFVIGKLLGAILTLAISIGLMGLVFVITVMVKAYGVEQPTVSPWAASDVETTEAAAVSIFDPGTVIAVIMIYMQFVVLAGVVLFFSVFLTPTVNFFMSAGVYMIGTLSSVTQTLAGGRTAEVSPLLAGFYKVLHVIIPNFDKFNQTNPILHPETQITNPWAYTGQVALIALLYTLIMMLLAVIIFERREV